MTPDTTVPDPTDPPVACADALRRPMSRTDDLFPRRYSLNYLKGSMDLPGPAYLAKAPFHAANSEPSKGANDDVTVQHAYDLTSAELISPRF